MATPSAAHRSASTLGSSNPKPLQGSFGRLGTLPRKTSTGNSLTPGSERPGAHSFGRSGSFGRVGATVEPAAPAGGNGAKSGPGGNSTRTPSSRRLGSFNSLDSAPTLLAGTNHHATGAGAAGEEEHPLDGPWTFWFMHRNPTKKMSEEEFSRAMKLLGSCSTVHSFFSLYLHLRRPSSLPAISDLHLFLSPIKPVWEDPSNASGGKWTIRLRKGLADRLWEGVVLGLVGGGFEKGARDPEGGNGEKEVCGAVLSVRRDEDILAVWHRTGDHDLGADGKSAQRVKTTLQTLLSLPPTCQIQYKLNAESLDKTTHGQQKKNHGGASHHHASTHVEDGR